MSPAERMKARAARPWLPETALAGGLGDALLADQVSQWSEKWIAAGEVKLMRGLGPVSDFRSPKGGRWLLHPEGIALWVDEAADMRVAALMLDHRIEARDLREGDRKLIAGLSERALADFCSLLAASFGVGGSVRWTPRAVVADKEWHAPRSAALAVGGECLLELVVETDLLVQLVRKAAKKPFTGKIQPFADGLRDQPVEVGAAIGRSRTRLDELTTLQPGDVLLLDRNLSEPVELAVNGAPSSRRCVIDTEEAALRLRLIA